ncbi:MFS transporter [Klebsiella michiganensis]|uniref:MFS transporter n=1 Tax=Klebsiella michiganensis TaxID=1134687 RepID=A0AAX3CTZ2_9ENTR|nr:MFS transporter [Klebsiella michiganensis]QLW87959.1 MFS transporter [Klebsiella oxytoca]MBZ7149637.1 MFS transporter [Klebsiella michiganensis]MBZ7490368.1 MFS transporter [Klebsiella michiganensis]MBZ7601271.1 MFS transporter [Klebsiella michiganensis]MEB7682609.1 MFS transporter [Klebsiella michiganensis]
MNTPPRRLIQYGSVMLFPLAMIIYDFSAYLTTDLIQPGIIHIINELQADVTLAPASVSLYMAGGLALQWLLGPLSDRIGRRPVLLTGALVFALSCLSMLFVASIAQYFVARFIQGTSICFISTVGYVSIQEAFGETDSIRIMAALTSIVLLAPVIGPLAGAALMTVMHWKLLFAIIGALGLVAWALLLFKMPETVISQGRGFKPGEVLADFIAAFRHPVVLTGSLAVAFGNVPMITWVALSPVILIEHGGMSPAAYAWTQVPVFSGLIIASAIVANVVKDPTSPRFIWRTVPIQLTGLLILLVGNLLWPHVWFWSVLGTSIYALGIGLLYPVLFRFTLFSHHLPKGTVSATLNILALSAFAASIEATRWIYFHAGGRIAFHCAALMAGIAVVILVSRLLELRKRHQEASTDNRHLHGNVHKE